MQTEFDLENAFEIIRKRFKEEQTESSTLIGKLQRENKELNERIQRLSSQLNNQKEENELITASFNSLSVRYENLKRISSQLEAFRKVLFC